MSKYVFITVLCFCFFTNGYTQKTLSNYSYIVIPEQYDFLSEKDKYQINSLTKFLFNKYGFHAFFENELPENFIICDGLKADVIKVRAVLYTKLQIVINDCHGNEVYRSAEGRSKIKEFNKVFNDALRKAFANIIGLEVNQKEISFEEVSLKCLIVNNFTFSIHSTLKVAFRIDNNSLSLLNLSYIHTEKLIAEFCIKSTFILFSCRIWNISLIFSSTINEKSREDNFKRLRFLFTMKHGTFGFILIPLEIEVPTPSGFKKDFT